MNLPDQTFPGVLVPAIETGFDQTDTFLREDARPLTHVGWRAGVYPAVAPGEYAVWDRVMVFASADASDPRTGDHMVELGLAHKVGPLFYVLMVTLAGWCAVLILPLARRDS